VTQYNTVNIFVCTLDGIFIQWQCTCNITRRRLFTTIVAVGKQYVLRVVCMCL